MYFHYHKVQTSVIRLKVRITRLTQSLLMYTTIIVCAFASFVGNNFQGVQTYLALYILTISFSSHLLVIRHSIELQ